MQEDDLKVDVGDADEQEQEIDLDAKPEQEEPKEEIKVEEAEPEAEEKPVEEPKEQKEELNEYSDGVQKRIAKLTRKMREAERQKEEAIQYAKTVYDSANQIKQRYETLDQNYNKEFEDRVKSSMQNAQAKLREAINAGDIDAQVAAQTEIAGLATESARLGKIQEVRQRAAETEPTAARPATPAETAQPATAAPDPRADAWAAKNPWFGTDNAMTYTAFEIHKKLVEGEGFDPTSDEYYSEVDKRIRLEFPHKFDKNSVSTEQKEPVQNVASAKRPATKGRRKTVRLTPSQIAISKRLGVPLEEYAKQLIAKEE
mgnify:CR=1 FL=1|jgi:hypothetical protein